MWIDACCSLTQQPQRPKVFFSYYCQVDVRVSQVLPTQQLVQVGLWTAATGVSSEHTMPSVRAAFFLGLLASVLSGAAATEADSTVSSLSITVACLPYLFTICRVMQVRYSSASTKGHAEKARTSTAAFAQFRWTGMIPVLAKGLSGSQGIQRRILRRARVPFSCTPVSGPVVTLSGCMVILSTIVFVPGVWGFFNAIKAPQIDLSWQAQDLYRRLNGEYDLLMWTPRGRGAPGISMYARTASFCVIVTVN